MSAYDGAINGHEKWNHFMQHHLALTFFVFCVKQEWNNFNYFERGRCISERLGKIPLLCQGLDPLNGMANCPGYHGYERV